MSLLTGILRGAAAGIAGAGVMTAVEKAEQAFTHRPDSFVPAHTLAHLLGLSDPDRDSVARNWAMHYGTGALAGVLRAAMAGANLRGPGASVMHTQIRLSIDQTLENLTGVGAPPWTWPRDELIIDVFHKAVYAMATGAAADALVRPLPGSSSKRPLQGQRLRGFS